MKSKTLYILAIIFVLVFGCTQAYAQSPPPIDSSEYVSIVKQMQERGNIGEGVVRINQNSAITQMLDKNAEANRHSQTLQGYRIRIYLDNQQNARNRSEQIENKFKERYPEVGAYRSYTNPYFMVTVGDFRTVDEAIKFQGQLAVDYKDYSNTYIIKEKIFFPPIGNYE
ncbi:MAG: SPOR domain-containing protein [Prevotellaceae bacterium]|jgi:hypothetical protein|nr:SPOR domain-containing protein [Prevotellaceae bacterium]